ncbi:MAG: DMT family transporter, partial [Chloroflexota bacterium]
MFNRLSAHSRAILQALLVTFLWSTSIILIKFGLEDIPALTFAGLRYTLASFCLIPFAWRSIEPKTLRQLSPHHWLQFLLLGIVFYAVTQGTGFLSLALLPVVTINLLLSLTPVVVALLSIPLLREQSTGTQWIGITLAVVGAIVFFYPVSLPSQQLVGVFVAVTSLLANAFSAILGRQVNRGLLLPPVAITIITMGIGGLALLITGIATQGLPPLNWVSWAIVGWLAVVNSAFAHTLWNRTLQTLSAMESSTVQNSMMLQIPILAVIFLGEWVSIQELLGMVVAGIGILLAQSHKKAIAKKN